MAGVHHHHAVNASDLDVLDAIASMPMRGGPSSAHLGNGFDLQQRKRNLDTLHALRRPPIDPIVLAASLSSGPHVTRHHFHHSFGAKVESKQMSRSERDKRKENSEQRVESPNAQQSRQRAGSYANCDRPQLHDRPSSKEASPDRQESLQLEEVGHTLYRSTQGSRRERLKKEEEAKAKLQKVKEQAEDQSRQARIHEEAKSKRPVIGRAPSSKQRNAISKRGSVGSLVSSPLELNETGTPPALSSIARAPPISVRCYVRTRIPTPHGEVFCHLYRNNRDSKEHLALVVDTAQNAIGGSWESGEEGSSRSIRSRTLDEVWGPHETEMERIVRGAYAGRLGPNYQVASKASVPKAVNRVDRQESPLVRIHSECYTGETIGSQRCDCGEQLDEAIRLIHSDSQPARGVVVYLRQEGRGIGLLDKLMAYNLQDMGHDTVSANILLGHLADARKYDVAAEILRDLGVGSCRLLTNNPEKMEALESEGITVETRVPMVPRVWRQTDLQVRSAKKSRAKRRTRGLEESIVSQFDDGGHHHGPAEYEEDSDNDSDASIESYVDHVLRRAGATLVGASTTRGPELEKYLRTKVERMGHLLDLPQEQSPLRKTFSSTSLSVQGGDDDDDGAIDHDEEGPLTDEEHQMSEDHLQDYIHEHDAGDDDEDEDDQILISSQDVDQ